MATLTYAIVRYVVAGPVPSNQIPLYVLNKSISFTGLFLFAGSFGLAVFRRRSEAQVFGLVGTGFAAVHIVLSLSMLGQDYFDSFFMDDGTFSIRGQLAILFGASAGIGLLWQHLHPSHPNVRVARRLIVALAVAHVTAMGFAGWIAPENWHGGLPPITLLSAVVGFVGLAFGLRRLRTSESR